METIVGGKKIEYGVDERTGVFEARYNGEQYKHVTLSGLKSMLERQVKKKPLNINVVRIEYDHFNDAMDLTEGKIIAVHSGNGNLMIQWSGETSTEQFRKYRSTLLVANVDRKKLKQLYEVALKAKEAYEKFKEENGFDMRVIAERDSAE
jgi:hypothetical protein